MKTFVYLLTLSTLLTISCAPKINDSEKEIMTLRLDDVLRTLYSNNGISFYNFNVECEDLHKVKDRATTVYEGHFVVTFKNRKNDDDINMHIIAGFDAEQFPTITNSSKYDITYLVLLVNNQPKKGDSPYILPDFH